MKNLEFIGLSSKFLNSKEDRLKKYRFKLS